jgi:tRNA nucleotidyltransferase (CCA-adding enzyme)
VPRWDFSKLPDFLETNLPDYALRVVKDLAVLADPACAGLYLVGGGARELMRAFVQQIAVEKLQYQVFDLDFAVEGDAIQLAEKAAAQQGGTLLRNEDFRTATWTTKHGYRIDLATSRREHYPVPGHLPEVLGEAGIYEDLLRRDFTANALAVSVSSKNFGELYDPVGGIGDIFSKTLRVLHPASFLDDPTRMLRAIRYALRLNYTLEEQTRILIGQALEESYLDLVTPERIRHEVDSLLAEPMWFGMIWTAHTMGVLEAIHPLWAQPPSVSGRDAEVLELGIRSQSSLLEAEMIPPSMVRLSWVLMAVGTEQLPELLQRIGVHQRMAQSMLDTREQMDKIIARMNHPGFSPSRIYRVCVEYPRKTLLFTLFNSYLKQNTEPLRSNLVKHLEEYSPMQVVIPGDELIKLGLPPGPLVGSVQEELWWSRIDGEIPDREAALKKAQELISHYVS